MARNRFGLPMMMPALSINLEAGTYTLTYGEAVDLGYCRPVTFHRHEGKFTIDLENGNELNVSGHKPPS